jgi:hypothetical protein
MGTLRGLHTPEDAEQRALTRREKKITDDLLSEFMTMSDLCYDFLMKSRWEFIDKQIDPLMKSLDIKRLGHKESAGTSPAPGYFVHRVLYSGPENCIIIIDIGLPAYLNIEIVRNPLETSPYPESIETALRLLGKVAAMSSPNYKGEEDDEEPVT